LVAADIPNLDWSKITSGKPTTLAGYGITDAASDSAVVHLAGTETVSGAKTFSAVVNVSNATASTSSTTGSLTVAGGLGVAGSVMAGAGSAGTPAIGFNTSNTTAVSYTTKWDVIQRSSHAFLYSPAITDLSREASALKF
jgi:hypothetical protein